MENDMFHGDEVRFFFNLMQSAIKSGDDALVDDALDQMHDWAYDV